MLIILAAIVSAVTIANPDAFLNPYNLHNLLRQIGFLGICAIGAAFVIITAGIDLSVGSLIAFCGVLAAIVLEWQAGWQASLTDAGYPIETAEWLALPLTVSCAVAAGVLVGMYHGFMVARFDIPPFVVTLGSMCILRSVAYLMTGAAPIPILNEPFNALGNEGFLSVPLPSNPFDWGDPESEAGWIQWVGVPISFWICLAVAAVGGMTLSFTRFGRNLYAVGGNEHAARLSGVPVFWTKTGAYAISGGLTAVAGILYAAYDRQGSPGGGMAYELNAIAAAVIGGCGLMGGSGGVTGALIGASIFAAIINGINLVVQRNASFWEGTIVGIVVVAAVTFNTVRAKRVRG